MRIGILPQQQQYTTYTLMAKIRIMWVLCEECVNFFISIFFILILFAFFLYLSIFIASFIFMKAIIRKEKKRLFKKDLLSCLSGFRRFNRERSFILFLKSKFYLFLACFSFVVTFLMWSVCGIFLFSSFLLFIYRWSSWDVVCERVITMHFPAFVATLSMYFFSLLYGDVM